MAGSKTSIRKKLDGLSLEHLSSVFQHSPEAILVVDESLHVLEVNPSACQLSGQPRSKLIGLNIKDLFASDDVSDLPIHSLKTKDKEPVDGTVKLKVNDGLVKVLYRFVPNLYPHFHAIFLREAENSIEELDELEVGNAFINSMLNITNASVSIVGSNYRVIATNARSAKRLGYTLEDYIGMSLDEIFPPDLVDERKGRIDYVIQTKKPLYKREYVREFHLDTSFYPLINRDGSVDKVLVFAADVNERSSTENELYDSERIYRLLVENLEEGINIGDTDENLLFVNEKAAEIFGVPRTELIGRNLREFVDEENTQLIRSHTKRRIQGEASDYYVNITRPDGEVRTLFVNASPFKSEETGNTLVLAAFIDVTEQMRVEKELEDSRRKYELLVENLDEGIGIVNEDEVFVFVNEKAASIFGVGRNELVGQSLMQFLDDENEGIINAESQKRSHGVSSRYEHEITRNDGEKRIISVVATPFNDSNTGQLFVLGAFQDITDSKKIEKKLRDSEERLRSTIASMHDLIFVIDLEGRFTEFFQPDKSSSLLLPVEEFINKQFTDVLPEEVSKKLENAISALQFGKNVSVFDYSLDIEERETWHSANVSARLDSDGAALGYTIVSRDITGRKIAEEALMESERRLRTTFDTMLEGCVIISHDWRFLYVNDVAAAQAGTTTLDLIGRDMREIIANYKEDALFQLSQITMEGRIPQVREIRYTSPGGREMYLDLKIQPVPEGLFILSLDITERKKAETELRNYRQHLERIVKERTTTLRLINEQLESEIDERHLTEKNLRESEEKFRNLVENAHDGIMILQDERIVYVNNRYTELLGYSKRDVLYQDFRNTLFEEDVPHLLEIYYAQLATAKPILMLETRFKNANDEIMPVEISSGRINYRGAPAVFAFVRDVTQRRIAEQKLEQHRKRLQNLATELTLAEGRERRRIAVDLHDHIGQNLIFSRNSLENLRDQLQNRPMLAELNKISEMLDQTIDDTRSLMFEISPPILYDLGIEAALEWLLSSFEERHGLSFVFQSDDKPKELDIDTSIMIFQASREALVNVLKHAEAESVVMRSTLRDEMVRIEIEDDGVGFNVSSLGGEWRSPGKGFGLFSVRERIISLGGSFSIESKPGEGTRVSMSLPTLKTDVSEENEASDE